MGSTIRTEDDFFDLDDITSSQKMTDLRGHSVDISAVQEILSRPQSPPIMLEEREERDSTVRERISFFEQLSPTSTERKSDSESDKDDKQLFGTNRTSES